MSRNPWSPRTQLIAAGRPAAVGAPLNTPIVAASNYTLGAARDYARGHGTPTWEAMEEVIGRLEGGSAIAFASGMAAIAAVLDTLPVGARVAAPHDCYAGTGALLRDAAAAGRWSVTWLDPTETGSWTAALDHDLLWLESPTNPMLHVMDLPTILHAARQGRCRTVVDNTFATPLGQQPLRLGADLVVHSATKYLGGHSDLMAGVVVTSEAEGEELLRGRRTLLGGTPGMLEAFLVTRGLRTLGLRVDAAGANAAALAERLAEHPEVTRVRYPGLPSHPGHALAASFMDGFGAMVSFEVSGGSARADRACRSTALIRHATSLGGVESTMERRGALAGQEHVPAELIRLSVGCEDLEDLWTDLAAALGRSGPAPGR